MQLFIGLTFLQNHLHYQKIDSFRKRFDRKYGRSQILQMTLLPPFWFNHKNRKGLEGLGEHLEEELETHLHGLDDLVNIPFSGFDFKVGRGSVLYLRPELNPDLFHCQEVMSEVIESRGGLFKKEKSSGSGLYSNAQTFLPIGRFCDSMELELSVEKARIEFSSYFSLFAKNIVLFEKLPGHWIPRVNLHTFSTAKNTYLININEENNMLQL